MTNISFLHDIEWYVEHTWQMLDKNYLNKSALWMCPLFKEYSDLFCELKKLIWFVKKSDMFLCKTKNKILLKNIRPILV